jgi:DnaJ-class molecular chaperone
MTERMKVKLSTCWRCLGTGTVRSGMGIVSAVVTLGISSLFGVDDEEECPVCDGEGKTVDEVDITHD